MFYSKNVITNVKYGNYVPKFLQNKAFVVKYYYISLQNCEKKHKKLTMGRNISIPGDYELLFRVSAKYHFLKKVVFCGNFLLRCFPFKMIKRIG